jgi:hypothetical protein
MAPQGASGRHGAPVENSCCKVREIGWKNKQTLIMQWLCHFDNSKHPHPDVYRRPSKARSVAKYSDLKKTLSLWKTRPRNVVSIFTTSGPFSIGNNDLLHMVLLWKFEKRTLVVNNQLNAVLDDVISAHPIHSYSGLFFPPQFDWIRGSLYTSLWSSYEDALHNVFLFIHHSSHFKFTVPCLLQLISRTAENSGQFPGLVMVHTSVCIFTGLQPNTCN